MRAGLAVTVSRRLRALAALVGIGALGIGVWAAGVWAADRPDAGAQAEFLASIPLVAEDGATLQGISGVAILSGGARFLALSDHAALFVGEIRRDSRGVPRRLGPVARVALRGMQGQTLYKMQGDSEGLALGRRGAIWISFEGKHRIARYDLARGTALSARAEVPPPPQVTEFGENSGMEALALAPDGALWTMSETPHQSVFVIWRHAAGRWTRAGAIARDGAFMAVGADFGPDGRLYLLERAFWGPLGFVSRLRRFAPADLAGGAPQMGQVLMTSVLGQYDNLEGLAVWRDGAGRLRASMVSDDNFRSFQRAQLVEYRLPD
ncbi:esterase-like activity of phytase family protein [Phaeovulum vinaykumarii]|uniref:Phytase-like domain-containing protein n=1 Tax=Phaeovulum vinaykumarii TaxID=407234 RepID=A0A1N7KB93_9RHOB|nr:esterase-like activity of phytase family protein [Phaeovulum vinaykumarii]SIS58866.1 hypothetical protein SAMN05421795_101784 [Phaeovulum vinaykumarii]SOB93942.1 hypothetical protein SAMN05878426_101780 [Phaeovulum vinaykumarii]